MHTESLSLKTNGKKNPEDKDTTLDITSHQERSITNESSSLHIMEEFPKCNNLCNDDYCCKCCNCDIHWYCATDNSDKSLLGHGAHYCCVRCKPDHQDQQVTTKFQVLCTLKVSSSNIVDRIINLNLYTLSFFLHSTPNCLINQPEKKYR